MNYKLTYGMLLEQLKTLTPEQLALDVVTFKSCNEEVSQMVNFDIVGEDLAHSRPVGVLDEGYPYLIY